MMTGTSLFCFRELLHDDLDSLVTLEAEATVYPWSRTALQQSIEAGHSGYVCCADKNNLPVAYAVCTTVLDETSLLNLCVARDYQGQGLGRALLSHLIQQVKKSGSSRLFLEVRESNRNAIHLYEALGFVQDGRRKGYYTTRKGKEDALLYSLSLGEGSS